MIPWHVFLHPGAILKLVKKSWKQLWIGLTIHTPSGFRPGELSALSALSKVPKVPKAAKVPSLSKVTKFLTCVRNIHFQSSFTHI